MFSSQKNGWYFTFGSTVRIIAYFSCAVTLTACGKKNEKPKETQFRPPLEAACEAGQAPTCIKLGQTFENRGELESAISMFTRACDLGSGEGCLYAGGALLEIPKIENALQFLGRGCDLEEPAACYGAGVVYSGGYGTPSDPKQAIASFAKACEHGLDEGCGSAAILRIENATADQARDKALDEARTVCGRGDASTCFALGQIESDRKNYPVAVNFYRDACRLGDGVGCRALALAYVDGQGVERDPVQAAAAFEKGCIAELSDVSSCAYYGYARYQNADSDEERATAKAILNGACEAKEAEACFRMALVEPGNMAWVKRACELSPNQCDRYSKATQPK